MKSISLNKTIFIALTLLLFFLLFKFTSPLYNYYGNAVMGKVFLNSHYKITEGSTGIPFQFGFLSSFLIKPILNSVNFLNILFITLLFLTFLYFKKYSLFFVLLFPLFILWGPENLNFINYLLFLMVLLTIKKNKYIFLLTSFIIVNFNPMTFPILLFIFLKKRFKFCYYLVLFPINIIFVILRGGYYIPSFIHYLKFSPFIFYYIIFFYVVFLLKKIPINFTTLLLMIYSLFEPEIFPYVSMYILFNRKSFSISVSKIVLYFILLIFFHRGLPLGNGQIIDGFNKFRIYDFEITKRMPHYGKIYHPLNLGYIIDYIYYPNVGATKAFYAKCKYKFSFMQIEKIGNKNWKSNELGLIIFPTNDFYWGKYELNKFLKNDNLLLTYISPSLSVLDRDPNRHIILYYEPYYLQKIYLGMSLKDYEKDDLWFYIDNYFSKYRDINSLNLSLFVAQKLNKKFLMETVKERLKNLKKDKNTYLILSSMKGSILNEALLKFPYDYRFWYIKYKKTKKRFFLKLAKLFNKKIEMQYEK